MKASTDFKNGIRQMNKAANNGLPDIYTKGQLSPTSSKIGSTSSKTNTMKNNKAGGGFLNNPHNQFNGEGRFKYSERGSHRNSPNTSLQRAQYAEYTRKGCSPYMTWAWRSPEHEQFVKRMLGVLHTYDDS